LNTAIASEALPAKWAGKRGFFIIDYPPGVHPTFCFIIKQIL
jgi:hypothetical protein